MSKKGEINMKKSLYTLLILLLLFLLIGCNNSLSTDNLNNEDITVNTNDESSISIMPINYDFESVIELSDDIFIGRLIGVRQGKNLSDNIPDNDPFNALRVSLYFEYEFEITSIIFAGYNRNPETIKVYFHDYGVIKDDLGYNPMYDCAFHEGYEYLLPVQITDKAYYKDNVYHIPGDMVLSLDQVIARDSSLTGVHSIVTAEGNDLTQEVNKNDVISYVNKLIQNKEHQNSYTGETNINKIADFSNHIFKVRVKELVQTRQNEIVFGETYMIEILEVIKGNNNFGSEELKVDFIGGTVNSGDIIYVGLDIGSTRYGQTGICFNLTSKILFTSDEIYQIRERIEN